MSLILSADEKEAALNLLAVMHRDGGHHTAKVGFVQSCRDAEQVRHSLVGRIEIAEAQLAGLKRQRAPGRPERDQ